MFQKAFLRPAQARGLRWGMVALCAMGAIVLLAVGSSPLPAQTGTVTVRVDPATRAAPVNGTFTVQIVADDAQDVGAYEFDLVYDPNYLEVISVSDAGELDSEVRTVNELGPVNVAAGRTAFGAYSCYEGTTQPGGPSGTVVLATVTLRAKQAGVTTLSLENALVTDTQANEWPDPSAGRYLNVEDGTVTVLLNAIGSADFDGNRTTDLTIWRPSTWVWWVRGQFTQRWGEAGDIPVPGDYNGDGKTDLAIWRPSTGVWWVRGQFTQRWGEAGDIPVAK